MQDAAIEAYLDDGWELAGYSVNLMVAGALAHHIMLRKGSSLTTVTVVSNAGKEVGRSALQLAPLAPAKKGFFA
ncbi:MAG: hypothetical protein MUE83_00820 [Tabrizicola sp.]|nr:hypothetical protein [Tabrizicola sp.]